MPDTRFGQVLDEAAGLYEPDPEFVERLSGELRSTIQSNAPAPKPPADHVAGRRSRVAAVIGVAAGLSLVFGLVAILQMAWSPAGELVAEEATIDLPASSTVPIHTAASISRTCDRFVFEVPVGTTAPGSSRPGALRVSHSVDTGVSPAFLLDLRTDLGHVTEVYQNTPGADTVVVDSMRDAIRELGLASLYLQMGETTETQRHLEAAESTLARVADAPFFAACSGL